MTLDPRFKIDNPRVVEALRTFADHATTFSSTHIDEILVHIPSPDRRSIRGFSVHDILNIVLEWIEVNEIDTLKLEHIRNELGADFVDSLLKRPTRKR